MRLVAAESGIIVDGTGDAGQTPGETVFQSAADTDLTALAAANAATGRGRNFCVWRSCLETPAGTNAAGQISGRKIPWLFRFPENLESHRAVKSLGLRNNSWMRFAFGQVSWSTAATRRGGAVNKTFWQPRGSDCPLPHSRLGTSRLRKLEHTGLLPEQNGAKRAVLHRPRRDG